MRQGIGCVHFSEWKEDLRTPKLERVNNDGRGMHGVGSILMYAQCVQFSWTETMQQAKEKTGVTRRYLMPLELTAG